jgi:hypothetical protein
MVRSVHREDRLIPGQAIDGKALPPARLAVGRPGRRSWWNMSNPQFKPAAPFWAIEKNFVINVNHIAWFQKHSDNSLTICLSTEGPNGSAQINVTNVDAIEAFMRFVSGRRP